jgi:hypothetical protein
MVNWSDPDAIAGQAAAFMQVLLVLLGLYAWEVLNTMSFDYNILVKWRDIKVSFPISTWFIAPRVLIDFVYCGLIVANGKLLFSLCIAGTKN